MASNIAQQISDDYDSMIEDSELDCTAESNEHLLDIVQGQSVAHISNGAMDTYKFRDNSSISFKGQCYRVGGVEG